MAVTPELQKLISQLECRAFPTPLGDECPFSAEVEEKFNDCIIHIMYDDGSGEPKGVHALYAVAGEEESVFQEFLEQLDRHDDDEPQIGGAYTWLTEILVTDYQERIALGWGDWIVGDNRIRHAKARTQEANV